MSAYYSRLQALEWMKFYLCLDEVRIEQVVELDEQGQFVCPYTHEVFTEGDLACPCWPRLPMGWNWSVYWAVDLAERLLQEAQEKIKKEKQQQTISLNITKTGHIQIANGPFQGAVSTTFSQSDRTR